MSKLSKVKERQLTLRGRRYYVLITQLPFMGLAGYILGYLADRQFGTAWIAPAGMILGAVGGLTQLIREVLRNAKADHAPANPNQP